MKKNILVLFTFALFSPALLPGQANMSKKEKENIAKLQLDDKQYEKSIASYTHLIDEDSNNAYYFDQRGLAYFYMENYSKAKENFAMATLYSDKNPTYWANLGAAYNYLDDLPKAYDASIKALRYGKSSQTVFNAASNANNVNRLDEGLSILNDAGEFYTNGLEDLYARIYKKKKDYQKSIQHFEVFFKNYNSEKDNAFNVLTEKRSYFFVLIAKMGEDANKDKLFKPNTTLKSLFVELVNNSGYEFDSEFISNCTYEMIILIKANPDYLPYFNDYSGLIKDDTQKHIFSNMLNDKENYK